MRKWGRFMPGCTEVWLTNVPSVSPTTPQPAHTHMKRLVSYLPPFSLPVLHMILSEKQTSSVDKGYKLICGIIAHFLQQQHNQSILNFLFKRRSLSRRILTRLGPTLLRLQQASGIMVLLLDLALLQLLPRNLRGLFGEVINLLTPL